MSNILIEKLKTIQGQELKYGKFCEAIGLKKKTGESKIKQLQDLQMYCELDRLEKPTRFVVNDVYEAEIKAFEKVNGNNKYQTMFDAVVYQAFLDNNGATIYLSSTEMLKLFAEVNENFVYCYNSEQMVKLGADYCSFCEMGRVARKILVGWTQSRLNNMAKRCMLEQRVAYRLYTSHKGTHGYYKIGHNVQLDSELHKQCLAIYAQAIDEIVPKNLLESSCDTTTLVDTNDKQLVLPWLPFSLYDELNRKIAQLTKEKFNNQYCDLKRIVALTPPATSWVVEKLTQIYQSMPALSEINKEACRKILTTSQLDEFTGYERRKFIDVNMSREPKVLIKNELAKIK